MFCGLWRRCSLCFTVPGQSWWSTSGLRWWKTRTWPLLWLRSALCSNSSRETKVRSFPASFQQHLFWTKLPCFWWTTSCLNKMFLPPSGETLLGLRESLTWATDRLTGVDSSVAVSSGGELFLRFISLTSLEHQVRWHHHAPERTDTPLVNCGAAQL